MKEVMIPYILLMWILVSTGAIKWTLRSCFWIVSGGVLILVILGVLSRLWAPVDLTYSSTVKAPHAVLSPLFGEEIDEVHVRHNQIVKQGEIIYTLVDTKSNAEVEKIKSSIVTQEESIAQFIRDLERTKTSPDIFKKRDVEYYQSQLRIAKATLISLHADLEQTHFEQSRKTVRAQFDGQVAVVNVADGSRVGNMHLYDTGKKFIEMRIPDQTFRYVEKGQFAEFYVDAYPGEVFRARVHSFTAGTGESSISPIQGPQSVRQHVGANTSSHGRTVILEIFEPEGKIIPIGATGSAWIAANKPHPFFSFIDVIGAATVRLHSYKSYLNAM
ncbi:efflux RND transporter periplasmic adaptor subunit [Shewanella sp. 1_MG-2023]|uniref:efflux RND transporter periplasmic adaptor subunit n=1 Tax=unclassified Shewanella TaxID=196818 RepID=UPI0026E2D3AA|nr:MULTISPECIES: biotin/lipoyl-binding protein [unclassified Shewanella]MDO6611153.1 efflux RND transporter periplasmic adaptor subunit [Shewanella sp. 7_MG-2023]MDO6770970.1 efflux RND transporter periplasmic adaptor subunit [Shewanella sp. 2_MG-2023]MDO6794643.1 efflux RND transporter periplasmic adaptor subunit [Shewanella sp. 1_MG-2023]